MMQRKLDRPDGCPSDFTFDRHLAGELEGEEKTALEGHLTACDRCAKRLAEISLEKDAWKRDAPPLALSPRLGRAGSRASQRWSWVAGAVALAACLVLFVRSRTAETPDYVGTKGTPAVQLLVHRGAETNLWDGHTRVHPGDALALRVACEGLKHLVVAAPANAGGNGDWQRLSEGACPSQGEPLPFTLVVDEEPGDEKLAVVLSQDAMNDAALRRAIESSARTTDVWVVDFVLPKETGTRR
jgi:hypothetical protein